MSRVEENEKMINDVITSLSTIGENGMTALTITQPEIANAVLNYAKTDILTDISRSLAVIADGITGEKSNSNPVTLIENKLKANGITSKEWDIWVYFREKYIFGKNAETFDDVSDAIQNVHVPVKNTSRICGFCKNADVTHMDLDNFVCPCPLHNIDVLFTCSACEFFVDVQSDMTFEEFIKRWGSYFDEDETGVYKKAWLKELWFKGAKTLREKYGDIEE